MSHCGKCGMRPVKRLAEEKEKLEPPGTNKTLEEQKSVSEKITDAKK